MARGTEIEIKLAVTSLAAARARARRIGAVRRSRVREDNLLFDTPAASLRKRGELLRLRVCTRPGGRAAVEGALLTHKGPGLRRGSKARFKERREAETLLPDPALARRILRAAGFAPVFRYQKFRTTFVFPDRLRWARGLHLLLDETPAGKYWELEGPRRAIERAARLLGYSRRDYLTASYLALWAQRQARRSGRPRGGLRAMLLRRAL